MEAAVSGGLGELFFFEFWNEAFFFIGFSAIVNQHGCT
jgi:hypothetical protein